MANPITSTVYTSPSSPKPTGWNKWSFVKNFTTGITFPDAMFPRVYTPSSSVWVSQLINNCSIPWISFGGDPFSLFLLAGGGSSTLIGSLTGVATATTVFSFSGFASFGIGKANPGPQVGYCIGKEFKQHIYVRIDVINVLNGPVAVQNIVELLQNSKFKRMYVHHGTVIDYTTEGNERILTLDIDSSNKPAFSSVPETTVKIITKVPAPAPSTGVISSSFSVNVLGVRNDWKVVISDTGSNIPKPGDYYEFNTTWCIEDPYLLSGFWKGTESQDSSAPSNSPYNMYVTTQNRPYEEGKFLGAYIWSSSNSASTQTTTNVEYTQPMANYPMSDASGYTWAFYGFGNSNGNSPTYNDDTRYKENVLKEPNEDGSYATFQIRNSANGGDYNKVIQSTKVDYIRVDIGYGGYTTRNNWFAPCLIGSYIKVSGKTYKIVGQPEATVIDVDINSVDLSSKFDPSANRDYSLVNQYGWLISEHFDGYSDFSHRGIFYGSVSGSGKNYTIDVTQSNSADWYVSGGLSFIDRYKNDAELPNTMKKGYKKYQGWKLVKRIGDKYYDISNVAFEGDMSTFQSVYRVNVELSSETTEISSGESVYIIFDSGFEPVGNWGKTAYYYYSKAVGGADKNTPVLLASTSLCMDGEYLSIPYRVNVPLNTRIGFCGSLYFGVELTQSGEPVPVMLVTTLRQYRGVASLFHALKQEDWVVYLDPVSQNITIRRGSLDFTEYPMKTEIFVGKPSLTETTSVSGKSVSLNVSQDRLSRIQFDVPDYTIPSNPSGVIPTTSTTSESYLLFTLSEDSFSSAHGFIIDGKGKVSLTPLTAANVSSGSINSDYWSYEGQSVSPVYIYKKCKFQNLKKMSVDFGVSAKDIKKIYVQGGTVSSAVLQYCKDSQVLSPSGIFDVVRMSDGTNIVIYSQSIGAFRASLISGDGTNNSSDGELNNSIDNQTSWTNKNCVMIIGSFNDYFYWGTPFKKGFDVSDSTYPMMVLNSTDYLGCIYNPNNETFCILSRCYEENKNYLGCFVMSSLSMASSKKEYMCKPVIGEENEFIFRQPLLYSYTRIWTDVGNVVRVPSGDIQQDLPQDDFVRVMGSAGLNCQFVNTEEFGIISTAILDDGTYVVFYDSNGGVKAVFSNNCGVSWAGNNVSYSRNGSSGLWLADGLFFSITPEGIEKSMITLADLQAACSLAYKKKEGVDVTNEEVDLQETIDTTERYLIGSGAIDFQRLSGYITQDGTAKLFFYGNNNSLSSMDSIDGFKWKFTNNF